MEPDCYGIDILHYLNPHLIWIEISDQKRKDEFVFEQIGVYGVLPFETTIELSGKEIKGQRCDDWVPAAAIIMKEAFSQAQNVFFRPTFIDRRSSIFDDNIHKFGEIIIETSDKEQLELSKVLVNAGFAIFDVCLFHQELSVGHINTKLSLTKSAEVVRHLEKGNKHTKKESNIKKHTTVFQAAQSFESALTTMNLELHNRRVNASTIESLIERKMKDFNMCKDIEEESLGCASVKHANLEKQKLPLLLKKKLDLQRLHKPKVMIRERPKNQDPLHVLNATKKFLEENTKYLNEGDSNMPKIKNSQYSENKVAVDPAFDSLKENNIVEEQIKEDSEAKDISCTENSITQITFPNSVSKTEKRKTKGNKIPEYDTLCESRVAYGPPGLDISNLSIQIVPKILEEEVYNEVSIEHKKEEETPKVKGLYDNVDSHVDLEITNKDALFNSLHTNSDDSVHLDASPSDGVRKDVDNSLRSSASNEEAIYKISPKLSALQRKLQNYNKRLSKQSDSSMSTTSDTTNKDSTTSFEETKPTKDRLIVDSIDCDYLNPKDNIAEIIKKIEKDYGSTNVKHDTKKPENVNVNSIYKNNVNPFKNVDDNMSVFVDKLVSPVLMVHTKMNKRIEPSSNMRDINFNTHVHIVLKHMFIEKPMMLQMVTWPVILRGFSTFMISPLGSGKTLGYLPAVCRLVTDSHTEANTSGSVGPTCVIVCATAQSVAQVEKYAKMFLGLQEKVLSCYAGINDLHITTSLLNGCDLFICTPPALSRLLQIINFGIDLRRLTTMVLDDCERLSEVYMNEIKYILFKIKEMYKSRVNKESKIQFIAASRVWCDLMEPIVKKAPNSVICIGAFQECVLYSKTNTIVDFVQKENKVNHILDYMKTINTTKRTIIVCRSDDEVKELEMALLKQKYFVFACNSSMTVEDLYNLNICWADYQEPILGPILVCCDGNLTHLNITNAHYLIHYSLPQLFSMFCKRFSVLNDNYSSLFKNDKSDIKIKVLIDEDNVEQLPKILHFIKRCTSKIPDTLNKISECILHEKDVSKGKKLIPICDCLLAFGECADFWNCLERHTIFKEHDQPKCWMPTNGVIKFKILHYHSAVHYSARLLSNTTYSNTVKYPQTYSSLHLKMGIYYSSDANKKLHGIPQVGDICAVSIKQNFFARCQVLKYLTYYNNGAPNSVLINLIDEEKLEEARDIVLFYLPDELKNIETSVVHVRLANVHPKDKDVTFSDLAKYLLKNVTDKDEDLYLRGQVAMTVGNCVFVDTLEACQELTSLNETVVRHNFKKELLEQHAVLNPDHLLKLKDLCKESEIIDEEEIKIAPVIEEKESQPTPQWSHFDMDVLTEVYFSWAINPGTFFVRPTKFESSMKLLAQDVDKYVEDKPIPINNVKEGQIVLAKFPGDVIYDRAKVYTVIDENKVKCFFVDHGDFKDVLIKDLLQIPDKFITRIPFQTVECYLIGLQPAADHWTEFGNNWFSDACLHSDINKFKPLYVKYYTKKSASYTGGHKYGVALIDTTTDADILINKLMLDLNLAQQNQSEINYLDDVCNILSTEYQNVRVPENIQQIDSIDNDTTQILPVDDTTHTQVAAKNLLTNALIRSVPLVTDSDSDDNKWEIVNPAEFRGLFGKSEDSSKESNALVETETRLMTSTIDDEPKSTMTLNFINRPVDLSDKSSIASNLNSPPLSPGSANLIEKEESNIYTKSIAGYKKEIPKVLSKIVLDSDDCSSAESSVPEKRPIIKVIDEVRKPKLAWRQNKYSVTIKIHLIGVDNYELVANDRSVNFSTHLNDVHYQFDLELYGVIDRNSCSHSNKGTYILLKFNKIIKRNWLTLTKDTIIRKWIVYDVDGIDTSSDEEEEPVNHLAKIVKQSHFNDNSDSDDDFIDDININDYNLGLD